MGLHYAALGVGPDASPEQLRAAYRAAVLRLHPDKAAAGGSGAAAGFQDVQLAWEVLRSEQGRVAYDRRVVLGALQAELAVAEQVDLDDMHCRCGGEFWLAEGDLREDADSLLVPCSTCSACIRVLYSLAPG
ncbi:hypothetical protein WJX81_004158 [Elliptochloris bilobata]|uniref:Uncharacterized protein n=1 Tax=Elliptochloris bilobata TaxID=381761 RepID=A0AAW1QNH7_9CHLO